MFPMMQIPGHLSIQIAQEESSQSMAETQTYVCVHIEIYHIYDYTIQK